jgi:hypothetical protein
MSDNCDNLLPEPWFTAVVLERPDDPAGFLEWTENITQEDYSVILPDGSKHNVKMFIDHQQVFNNGAYTNYLVNRYKDINGI